MAESIYKVATGSTGPGGIPIYDVFEGQRKLELPEFQQRQLNIDHIGVGTAPTGFQTQFDPVKLDVSGPVPASALESPTTKGDLNNMFLENQKNFQSQLEAQNKTNQELFNQALQRLQLTPEEKASQNRLLGLQQLQQGAIEGVQDRVLEGGMVRSDLDREIQNIASGNTKESLINLRNQTFEAQRLQVLQGQRQQELEALKMQLDQGNINTDNLFKFQQLNQEVQNDYFNKVQTLNQNARESLATILDKFQGLTLDGISGESLAMVTRLAQQAGIPLEFIRDGMKVVADQIKAEQALKQYQATTARINSLPSSGSGGGTIPTSTTGKPLTATQLKSLGYYERLNQADSIIDSIGSQFTGVSSYFGQYLPNFLKSDDRQRLEQAQRDFINAKLRQESGAAISESEFESAAIQYFPQPGDSEAVLEQKARNRQTVIESQALEAGQQPVSAENDPLNLR